MTRILSALLILALAWSAFTADINSVLNKVASYDYGDSRADLTTVSDMLRPIIKTRRSYFTAASITCWIRDTSEENVVTMTRPKALAMTFSSEAPTVCSDGV